MPVLTQADVNSDEKAYRACFAYWERLTPGPWRAREHDLVGNPLLNEILQIMAPDSPNSDYGNAYIWLHRLVSAGFLTCYRTGDTTADSLEWAKTDTPPARDTRSWSDRENAMIREQVARQNALFAQEAKAAADLARQQAAASPERAMLVYSLGEMHVPNEDRVREIFREEFARHANTDLEGQS